MKIGGFLKNSMIDYPGKLACLIFTCGCNFICPFCHNRDLVRHVPDNENTGFDPEEIFTFLEKRKGLIEGVAITGGEPTLQADILQFCERVKQLGYPVKIDTNGSRPRIIKQLIDSGLIDYIAMDIKTIPEDYTPHIAPKLSPEVLWESVDLIMGSNIDYEFRTTCAKPFVTEHAIQKIAEKIQGARLYALQAFNPDRVLTPEFYANNHRPYTPTEMAHFKSIADTTVRECVIR